MLVLAIGASIRGVSIGRIRSCAARRRLRSRDRRCGRAVGMAQIAEAIVEIGALFRLFSDRMAKRLADEVELHGQHVLRYCFLWCHVRYAAQGEHGVESA